MSSSSAWIVGDTTDSPQNESDVEASSRPLLQSAKYPTKTPFWRMLFFGSIVAAPYILGGMNLSFSAIALPQMNVNIDEASWYGSLPSFGSLAGAMSIGLTIDTCGRRPSIVLSIILPMFGWTLLAVNSSLTLAFVGQFLAGFMSGSIFVGQIYAAESIVVNHHHLRSSFSTWSEIAVCLGVLLDNILVRIMSYQLIACVAATIAVVSLLCVCVFIPESPVWLFRRGQIRRAKNSEKRLSIHQPALADAEHDVAFDSQPPWRSVAQGFQKLKRKDVYKPLVLMNVWFVFVVLSGGICIGAFQVNILSDYPTTKSISFNGSNSLAAEGARAVGYDMSLVSAVLVLFSVIMTSILVTHLGIKKLFSISAICMAVGMVGLGVSLSVDETHQEMRFWRVTHTVSIMAIIYFFTSGVVTVPVSVVGEMFPQDAKGFAGLPAISYCGLGGVLVKLHLYVYNIIGYRLYFIYAFVNVLSVIFTQIFVPETVGKTLEEIGEHYMGE